MYNFNRFDNQPTNNQKLRGEQVAHNTTLAFFQYLCKVFINNGIRLLFRAINGFG